MHATPHAILCARAAAPALGALLTYPGPDHLDRAAAAAAAFDGCLPDVAAHLRAHIDRWAAAEPWLPTIQDAYSNTFDLAPRCTLLASVHLFGPESFDRAQLMAGLAGAYADAGLSPCVDLPDHLSEILRAAPALPAAVWVDLVVYCLANALPRMLRLLDDPRAPTPWRSLIHAVAALVAAEVSASGLTPPPPPSLNPRASRPSLEAPHA